ncbi:CHAT domain-containing protein [Streptomyces sp. NPDC059853]|uniref:CHAT domain-containing protein n=1 Tax=Streptomyces sp. NPDC059853 TaxID=3346973 RepID=UPI0036665313
MALILRGEELHDQFDRTHDRRLLKAAQATFRHVLASRPSGELHAAALNGLGKCLWSRYERFGSREDIDRAVDTLRAAVAAVPDGHPMLGIFRANLSGALQTRWKAISAPEDLDEGIREIRAALRDPRADGRTIASRLNSLGGAMKAKSEVTEDTTALDEAVNVYDRARELARSSGDAFLINATSSNLAEALRLVHHQSVHGDAEALIRAVRLAVEALGGTPASHPLRARFHANLSLILMDLYLVREREEDLFAALSAARQALAATPRKHPNRAERLAIYARVMRLLFEHSFGLGHLPDAYAPLPPLPELPGRITREQSDILLAVVRAAKRAAAAAPPGHVLHGSSRMALASARMAEVLIAGNHAGRRSGLRIGRLPGRDLKRLAKGTAHPVHLRIEAAQLWAANRLLVAISARRRASAKAEAQARWSLDLALELLPRTVPRSLPRADRERQLARFGGIARSAAALSLRAQTPDPLRALRQLEHGRGVLIGQRLDTLHDVTDLRAREPWLADRFESLSRELDRPEAPGFLSGSLLTDHAPRGTGETLTGEDRHQQAVAWDAVVRAIRGIPGFEEFLRPPDPRRLLAALAPIGPVALINTSPVGCDALLLHRGRAWSVPLPAADFAQLQKKADEFTACVRRAGDTALPVAGQLAAQRQISTLLGWLWEAIAEPVLEALGFTGPPPQGREFPRMWWIPTGPLSALPLHAAASPHSPGAAVLDRVVSSYAATVRTLAWACSREASRGRTMLAVGMPWTPGAPELLGARVEIEKVNRLVPASRRLIGHQAQYASVLKALTEYTWFHLACHAISGAETGSGGHLLLNDHTERLLTAADIARLRLDRAELAYLSACETVRGHDALADEALHIAGAFHTAGFRHVVGTLWRVDDEAAMEIAEAFYSGVGRDAADSAVALHRAVRAQRERFPATPTLWAGHIHYGA